MDTIRQKKYFFYMISKSKKYFPVIFLLQITTLIIGLTNLKIANTTEAFIDNLIIYSNSNIIPVSIISLVIITIILFTLSLLNNFISIKLINLLSYTIRSDFLKSMNFHNFNFFNKNSSSEIYYRMFKDTAVMVGFFINTFIAFPIQILYIIIVLNKMLNTSILLTLYAVFLLTLQIISVIIFKKPIKTLVEKQKCDEQRIVYNVNEQFQKIEVIKTLGIEKVLYKKFENAYKKYLVSNIKNSFLLNFFGNTTELINQIWLFGVILIGGILIKKNYISLGGIFSFFIISKAFFNPVLKMLNTIINFEECKVSFNRFKEFFGFKQEAKKNIQSKNNNKLQNVFSIKDLTFFYDNNNIIFDNVTINLYAGEFIAIKGSSGIGKTTLFRIISRFLEPQEGILSIDGVDIKNINKKSYIEDIGLLLQNPIIFDETMRFNLTFDELYSDEDLFNILKDVGLYDFIYKQPLKLEERIGIGGIRLSEGQAQRLSIARILLRNPKILWLDEPTAQLDYNNKKEIINIIDLYRKKENALVVITTHDSYVLNIVDKIYEIKNHKISLSDN